MEFYDNGFPYKKIKRSDRRLNKPWISLGLLKSIKKKNKLYKKYFSNPGHLTRVKCTIRDTKRILTTDRGQQEIWDSKSNVKAT